jgi:hypothetical protein
MFTGIEMAEGEGRAERVRPRSSSGRRWRSESISVLDGGEAVYMGDNVFAFVGQRDEHEVPQSFVLTRADMERVLASN